MGLLISVTLLLALLFAVPIGMALAVSALAGILYTSPDLLMLLPQKFLAGLDSFPLIAIPLFIFAGSIMSYGGIARRIIDFTLVFVGRIPGGLGMVVIVATFFFGAICGSSSAKTAAVGSVMLPEMKRLKYPTGFATSLFAAAGGGSTLVPPALDLIIIGVVGNISIAGLFTAGILPSLLTGLGLMGLAYYYGNKLDLPQAEELPWKQKLQYCKEGILPTMMVVIVLGGIYGGIFTPTEASAVAVVYGLCLSVFIYKELTLKNLVKSLLHTASLSGVVLLMLATAQMLSFVLTFERIPYLIIELITNYATNWIIFVIFINVVFLLIGMFMDALPAEIVMIPIIVPIGAALGMEPIHIGILIAANVGVGNLTPPVGVTLFVACGISKIPIEQVIRPVIPFLIVLTISLLLISYVPEITLFLPRLMGYVGG